MTIGGVVLIARPPFIFGGHEYDENTLAGILYSLLSALSIAGLYICLRKMGNDVHYTITSFYYSILGFVTFGAIIWTTTGFNLICQVKLPLIRKFLGPSPSAISGKNTKRYFLASQLELRK